MSAKNTAKNVPAQVASAQTAVNPLAQLLPEKTLKKSKSVCEIVSQLDVTVYRRSDAFQLAYTSGSGKLLVSSESKAPEDALFGGLAPTQDPTALFELLTSAGYKL